MTTQDRLAPPAAAMQEPGVQGVKAVRHRQRRHELTPDIADQPLHLAFVVALTRPAKPVVEQIMALQFREHMRAQTLATLHNPRYREAGAAMPTLSKAETPMGRWLRGLISRAHPNTVVVALVAKMARIVCAVLRSGQRFEMQAATMS
jgi:hypothetical protein